MDLIDRQAAIDAVRSYYDEIDELEESIEERIEQLPSIDAVEVVRCKGCKHKYETLGISSTWFSCEIWHDAVEDDDFCSRAERRTDE